MRKSTLFATVMMAMGMNTLFAASNVADFANATVGEQFTLKEVVIDYSFGSYNYASANGTTVLLYDKDLAANASVGDLITVTGTVTDYYGVKQLQYPMTVDSKAASVSTIQPKVVTVAEFAANFMDYQNQFICFENVTVNDLVLTQGGSTTALFNKYGIELPASGTYNVVGYAAQFKNAHQIYPTTLTAVGGGDGGNTGDGGTVTPDASASNIDDFFTATVDEQFTLKNVVIDYIFGGYNYASANGKTVLLFDHDLAGNVAVGDLVTVTGTVSEYYDVMQLKHPITVDSKVASVSTIQPKVVTVAEFAANYMDYQNQLICFENVTVNDLVLTQSGSTTALFNKYGIELPTSGTYNVIGYAAQFKGAHQIYPTKLVAGTESGMAQTTTAHVAVAGTKGAIVVNAEEATTATVYDAMGRVVATTTVAAGRSSIALAQGMYLVCIDGTTVKAVVR